MFFEKSNKKPIAIILLITLMICLSACQRTDVRGSKLSLTVKEQVWGDEPRVNTYENIKKGTVLYKDDSFGTITVNKVNDTTVKLRFINSSFVEKNNDGTVNLIGKSLKKLTIKCGEEKVITTQTLDWGVTLSIKLEEVQ